MAANKLTKNATTQVATDNKKVLESLQKAINQKFGDATATMVGDKPKAIERLSTGSYKLDLLIGGGLPLGRFVEIYGPESSGKSTIATLCVAAAQKEGKLCAYIDAEQAIDPVYLMHLGVNLDELLIIQPNCGENALEIANALVDSGQINLIVIDSVAALVPMAELEGEMTDANVGMQARLMSKGLRKMVNNVSKNNCSVIFINQLREKIGVMFGNPETTTGGRALRFYSSIRIECRKGEIIKSDVDGKEIIGHVMKVKTVKNKTFSPSKETLISLIYGKGYDQDAELLDLACEYKIVNKQGSWFNYNEQKLGQGALNAKNYLLENQETYKEIKVAVIDKMNE